MISPLKNLLANYLKVGTDPSFDNDTNQQLFVSNLFSFIGYMVTFVLAISALVRNNNELAIWLFVSSCVFFFCHHVHRFKQLGDTIKISTRIIFVMLMSLMLFLVYSGGHAQTGPLWIYIVPPVAFFFSGLKIGLINILFFIVVVSLMLFAPNEMFVGTAYSTEFKTRLLYSFVTVTLLFGFYEYSRQKSYEFIRELSDKFEQQAMHDPLTNLPNRRGMREFLDHEYKRSRRSNSPLSVLLVDIDYFKKINDEFLHDGGDFVLEDLSRLFVSSVREQDRVARWGGEEFLFLLPETNSTDAFTLAEKIRLAVEKHDLEFAGRRISVTISIGLNEITPDMNIDQAINLADHYLYEAKKAGRNQTRPVLSSNHADNYEKNTLL
ncbi:GGDEF domain-containing protein [Alteromonas sp. W364]|jgi:diguanylate cyclase (GGDEF)-like protein|uniref:GGDEF domain-containing protein n=1 Tax=Alteromonas sp. W364 TaxID=3075610 RepID=UPI002886829A|nr:GGDEF domain-containing protein [Alteromonas sp. W364]MDT0629509.1 GGDEF domain-containing protein [Alteromonas sp. W364]